MANIEVTPRDRDCRRKVLVNGVEIPDVINVSMNVYHTELDLVSITIHADSFCVSETNDEQNQKFLDVK